MKKNKLTKKSMKPIWFHRNSTIAISCLSSLWPCDRGIYTARCIPAFCWDFYIYLYLAEQTVSSVFIYIYISQNKPSRVFYIRATRLKYRCLKCALENQAGPLWYLARTAGGSFVRNCTVPAGNALFFPLIANECSYAENPNLKSPSQLINCAKSADNNLRYLQLSMDGVAIPDLEKYRVTSTQLFNFTFAKDNIAGAPPGPTAGALDGWFAYVKPLPSGNHTIRFGGASVAVVILYDSLFL